MSGTLRRICSQGEFDHLLATASRPVLVDVSATWCGPCQQLTPILEGFEASQDVVDVVTIDADDPRALSWRLGGGSIPRMLLFDRGVLQMQVAGVRDRAWLDDVVGGYPALSIAEPDGLRLPPRAPARKVSLPAPSAGSAGMMIVHGHNNAFNHGVVAPAEVDVTADSVTVLIITTEAIESGYLRELDPSAVDQVRISGVLTGKHVDELVVLTGLQSLSASPIDQQPQLSEQEPQLSLEDLRPLASLPFLRHVNITGSPDVTALLPNRLGDWWLAPTFAAARRERGLPERSPSERANEPVYVSALLTRRPDALLDLKINLKLAEGWYAYPPGSDEGIPVSITPTSAHTLVEPLVGASTGGHLEGLAALTAVLSGDEGDVRVDVTVQVCDGETCLAPMTTALVVPIRR